MFCSPSTIISRRSRLLSFAEKRVRNFPRIPGIVYWKHFSYIWRITETYFHKGTCLLSRNCEICITLRYTSIQSYLMLLEHSPLPPLSLLHKISSGTIDAVEYAQTLRNEGKVSNDICLMFDEKYLQKYEEYFAGDLVDCDSDSEWHRRLIGFTIVGLKSSIPYVINSSPETKINCHWLKEELLDYLTILSQSGFSVRSIACD